MELVNIGLNDTVEILCQIFILMCTLKFDGANIPVNGQVKIIIK